MAAVSFHAVYPDADPDNRERLAGLALPRGFTLATHLAPVADDDEFVARCESADGVLLGWYTVDAALLSRLPRLRCISFLGIGVSDYVDLDAARGRGIAVCNTPGYGDVTVAEHALALMLAAARHLPRLHASTAAGGWQQDLPGVDLSGRTLALVGFGGIARALARLVAGFDMRVLAWTRDADRHREEAARLGVTLVGLDQALAEADLVSVHLALSSDTRGLLDAKRLARMKPGAILVNTARGALIDHDALVRRLTEAHLRAAGLDVFPDEPPPAGSPLLSLPNVVLTPHIAFNTPRARLRIVEMGLANLAGFAAGQPGNRVV